MQGSLEATRAGALVPLAVFASPCSASLSVMDKPNGGLDHGVAGREGQFCGSLWYVLEKTEALCRGRLRHNAAMRKRVQYVPQPNFTYADPEDAYNEIFECLTADGFYSNSTETTWKGTWCFGSNNFARVC